MKPTETDSVDWRSESTSAPDVTTRERLREVYDERIHTPLLVAWADWRTRLGFLILGGYLLMALVAVLGLWREPATSQAPRYLMLFENMNYPLGTTASGTDLAALIIHSTPDILLMITAGAVWATAVAVAIGTVAGGLIGVASGYFRGRLDAAIGLATDSMLAFPPLILLLAVVSAVDPSVPVIAASLAVLGIPTYVRLARANTMAFAQREFVMAARAIGARPSRIIMRELVPNVIRPLLSYSFIIIAVLIVAEASLSFLGVGIQRPTPTWGNMISAGQGEIQTTPHLVFVPGAVMFLTVFALNRLGDKARQVFDPKESTL